MHHDNEKSQAIHSSVTVLGLLKKKKKEDERNAWMAIFRTPTYNVIGRGTSIYLEEGHTLKPLLHHRYMTTLP